MDEVMCSCGDVNPDPDQNDEEVGYKQWLTDEPSCTDYLAVSAGWVETPGENTIHMIGDGTSIRYNDSVFEVSAELFDGEHLFEESFKIRNEEEAKIVREALSRVKKAVCFLERKIDSVFPVKESEDVREGDDASPTSDGVATGESTES